jgi:Ankyrin repeat
MNDRTKVLLLAVVLAGAGAAAWFLYLEEWVSGGPTASAPPKPVAKAPPVPAKPVATEAAKPVAVAATVQPAATAQASEPPKPVAAPKEPEKPMAAEPPKAEKPGPVAAKPPALVAPAPKEPAMASKEPAMAPKEPAMTPKEPAMAEAPAAPAAPRETPAPAVEPREPPVVVPVARGPSVPGPRFNDLTTAVLYRDGKAVEELLAFGKWPEKADSRGITPLMLAVMLGEAGMAEALLKAGANPNRPGPGGSTATSIARERTDMAMMGLLQSHGGR